MAVTHFKHFSDIGFLRRLNLDLLLAFLRQYEEYLTHRRSLALDGNLLTFPYQHLAEILLTPDSDIPMEMVEGLYLVHELSRKASMETLCRYLEKAKKLPTEPLPLEDLLLLTLIEKRDILDYVHAEQYLVRPKKFETVFCRSGHAPTIISEDLTPLENVLGEWFSLQRKGRGAKVYRFVRSDGIWFLIQHGKQLKCDFTHEENGDSRRIIYRPGTFDVLCFLQDRGELRMHTATKKDRDQYRRLFGRYFFDDEAFFQAGDNKKKYTLEPLKRLSEFSLACFGIAGLRSVELVEIQIAHDTLGDLREIYRSETNVFQYLDLLSGRLTEIVNIVRATFRLTFEGDLKSRCVTICTPNVTIYDREMDGPSVDDWLKSNGILVS